MSDTTPTQLSDDELNRWAELAKQDGRIAGLTGADLRPLLIDALARTMRYEAAESESASLREQVRALTAERDRLSERMRHYEEREARFANEEEALRARVAALEARDAKWKAGSEELQAECLRLTTAPDTARDAALEEAKVELNSLNVLGVPWAFAGILAVLDRLKTKPSRRFVDAEKVAKLEQALRDMLASADCEWENRKRGHDWVEACQHARDVLSEVKP